MDKDIKLVDVVLATASAPFYFKPHYIDYSKRTGYYVDGGIWANDPSLVGITESLRFFVGKNKRYKKYDVLSIGNINFDKGKPNSFLSSMWGAASRFWNVLKVDYLMSTMFDSGSQMSSLSAPTICEATNGNYTR